MRTEWWPTLEVRNREWIDFKDANGNGSAEPDAFVVLSHEVIVVEVKLTGCRYGHEQLSGLYLPLLSQLYKRPARGLQICKSINAATPGPFITDVRDFPSATETLATWHWPGR